MDVKEKLDYLKKLDDHASKQAEYSREKMSRIEYFHRSEELNTLDAEYLDLWASIPAETRAALEKVKAEQEAIKAERAAMIEAEEKENAEILAEIAAERAAV